MPRVCAQRCEYAADYDTMTPHVLDFGKMPDTERQVGAAPSKCTLDTRFRSQTAAATVGKITSVGSKFPWSTIIVSSLVFVLIWYLPDMFDGATTLLQWWVSQPRKPPRQYVKVTPWLQSTSPARALCRRQHQF